MTDRGLAASHFYGIAASHSYEGPSFHAKIGIKNQYQKLLEIEKEIVREVNVALGG